MAQDDSSEVSGPSRDPHRMRITSAGSIPNYVRFATDFLLDNPARPLVLHTFPSTSSAPIGQLRKTSTLQSCTLNVPRLISVVEQIKRDLVSPVSSKGKEKSKRVRGVWQYTESGLLPIDEDEGDGEDPLVRVLSGKTRPKMLHRPYLQITLSTRPLGLESGQNVACQYVLNKRRKGEVFGDEDREDESHDKATIPVGGRAHVDPPREGPISLTGQKRKSSVGAGEAGAIQPKKQKNKRKVRVADV